MTNCFGGWIEEDRGRHDHYTVWTEYSRGIRDRYVGWNGWHVFTRWSRGKPPEAI